LSTSSPAREVTMVGEAPPEPSGPLVRLSKPSSLCPDPHEVISGRDAHMTTCAKKTAFCRTSLTLWDASAPEIVTLPCHPDVPAVSSPSLVLFSISAGFIRDVAGLDHRTPMTRIGRVRGIQRNALFVVVVVARQLFRIVFDQ